MSTQTDITYNTVSVQTEPTYYRDASTLTRMRHFRSIRCQTKTFKKNNPSKGVQFPIPKKGILESDGVKIVCQNRESVSTDVLETVVADNFCNNLGVQNSGLDEAEDVISAAVEIVNNKLDGVNNKLDGVNNKLDGVNNELDGVNNELEVVNNELEVVNNELELDDKSESSSDECGEDAADSDYVPSQNENATESDLSQNECVSWKEKIRNERVFLVYESKLFELLGRCPRCGGPVDQSEIREVMNTGSQLHLKINCFNECNIEWKSQPMVGSLNGLGNLFISTSIAFSGVPFAKISRFAWLINLKFISDSVYYQIRRDFILPVVRQKWNVERKRMVELLKSRDVVVLVGDGRCDSPGHSAKYCNYTFMETLTGKVIDTVVVPVTEVKNSNAMEKEGFVRILRQLQNNDVHVDVVATDKHTQIRKLMRVNPEFNTIKHQFDPWHVAKNINKKINKIAKKKSHESLLEWVPSIVNHFWWSVTTANGDADLIYEKFQSIIYHTINKHEWPGCKKFKRCEHEPLTKEEQKSKNWLLEGSPAHQYLVSMVRDKSFKNDLKYLTDVVHTTNVEVFNNLLLKYIPKQYHFQHDHMVMGAYLAALDNNFNCQRTQAIIQSGEQLGKPRFKIAWRKPTKKLIARTVFEKKNYEYLKVMMISAYKRAAKREKHRSRKRIMAPKERASRDEIIEKKTKMARFKT
ncbi:uncharacterized protein LOC130649632 [Hydractinia symbiolongicarpus]|uniref:uncharacterized protein LOC130649632 n=1 Tax=Hydractinia symbiolongicarpus TaxID=13093 RepID=UPI00254FF543|nr:uncharacterized protein LOC130649632 [Hydractinia symbiolongicarpus]